MFNPKVKIAESKGIDLPILYVYLAGRIAGNCMEKCTSWRKAIRDHYKNYEGEGSYPISFIDPLNSGETKTADGLGLKSHIPANLIYDKDLLSVERADVIVANVEDYFEEGMEFPEPDDSPEETLSKFHLMSDKVLNRRENFGTICEIAWALYLQKPLILIVPESRKEIYMNHPFSKRASAIVTSVEELLQKKWLNILYKSISGATYE